MTQRTDKIDALLRQEIGQALEREVSDPRIGFVTVTEVKTTPDLSHARVWVSIIGSEEERKATLIALRRAMPYVRHGLGGKIRLRRIPELEVRLDESVRRGSRVLQIINELEAGRLPDDDVPVGESLPTPVPRLRHEGDAEPEDSALGGAAADALAASLAAAAAKPRRKGRNDPKGRPGSHDRSDWKARPVSNERAEPTERLDRKGEPDWFGQPQSTKQSSRQSSKPTTRRKPR
jgi:ribosome-binding factor A